MVHSVILDATGSGLVPLAVLGFVGFGAFGFAFSRMTHESNTLSALAAAFVAAVFLTACSSHRPTSDGHSPRQEGAVRPSERSAFRLRTAASSMVTCTESGILVSCWPMEADSIRRAGRNRRKHWQRLDTWFWPLISAAMANRKAQGRETFSPHRST